MGRRTICVIALTLALLGSGQVRAGSETLTVTIEYSAAPLCPELADFKTIVSNRLGYDAFQPHALDHVLVEIVPAGATFEGRIEWRTAEGKWAGERKFPSRSDDCQELARAMAFALALQIQFSAATGTRPTAEISPESPEAEKPAPEPPAPPAPPEPQKPVPPPLPEKPKATGERSSIAYKLGAGGAMGYRMSSKVTPLLRVFANLGSRYLVAEAAGELGLPTIIRREDGAGFGQQLILASLAGCGILDRTHVCLLVKGGLIRIAGQDIDEPGTPSGSIFQAGARLGLTQPLGWRLFAVVQAAGLVNLTRWQVTLDGFPVWSSPRLAATIGLDLGVSLP